MKGLLRRALTYQNHGGNGKSLKVEDLAGLKIDPESGITREDQQEILAEIEKVSHSSRIAVTPEIFTLHALKKGVLFPFLVNASAFLVLAAGIGILYYLFQQGESRLKEEQRTIVSAEGKLIQELKKENEARLLEKNREISAIQTRLQEIDRERLDLQSNMEGKIRLREEELRKRLEAELAAERARLSEQGLSEAEIRRRMQALETERGELYTRQLEAFRKEAETERIRSETNLKNLQAEYQTNLSSLTAERQRVLEEARRREDELQRQLEERTRALSTEKSQAQEELRKLEDLKKKEAFALDHLLGLYGLVRDRLQAAQYQEAQSHLQQIRSYLDQAETLALPELAKRREIELFMADSLGRLIDVELKREKTDTGSLIAAANLITEIKARVVEADHALAAGDPAQAEAEYRQALALVPEIQRSHAFFMEREREGEERRRTQLREALRRADAAFAGRNYPASLEQYAAALSYLPEDRATVNRLIAQIRQAGSEIALEDRKREQSEAAARALADADRLYGRQEYKGAISAYAGLLASYPQSVQVEPALRGITRSIEAQDLKAAGALASLQGESEQKLKGLEESLTARAAGAESRAQALEIELQRLQAGSVAVTPGLVPGKGEEAGLSSLKESYQHYTAEEDRLVGANGEQGLVEAKRHLNNFLASEGVEEVFPGLWGRLRRYDQAFEKAGRLGAYREVADIVLTLTTLKTPEARAQFLNREIQRSRNDPVMSDLLQEIKRLIIR